MISKLRFLLFSIINFCYFLFNHIHDYCRHAVFRYAVVGFFQIHYFFPKQFCRFRLPLGKNLLFENFTQSFFIYLPKCLGRFFLFFFFTQLQFIFLIGIGEVFQNSKISPNMVKYYIYGYLQAMPHSQPFGLFHGRLAPYNKKRENISL